MKYKNGASIGLYECGKYHDIKYTEGGTASNELRATLPFANSNEIVVGGISDGKGGFANIRSNENFCRFYKYDTSNFTLGATKIISSQFSILI